MKKVTKSFRIYGADGHRQRESFGQSVVYNWSKPGCTRVIEIVREDITGTNDYVDIRITRNSASECDAELWGQLSDGLFENSRYGVVQELPEFTSEDLTHIVEILEESKYYLEYDYSYLAKTEYVIDVAKTLLKLKK